MREMYQFVHAFDEHPLWGLCDSLEEVNKDSECSLVLDRNLINKRIADILVSDKGIQLVYSTLYSRIPSRKELYLYACRMNKGCEGLMNNSRSDDGRKEIYEEVFKEEMGCSKEFFTRYYNLYQEIMRIGYLNIDIMFDHLIGEIE